jgi:TM2 domain-containing membrane protein YozV
VNPVCPYCRTEVNAADGGRVDCPECHTPHHQDCFTENGGCTVFGCSQAPVDEPKISLTGPELAVAQPVLAERPGLSVTTVASSNQNGQSVSYMLFPVAGSAAPGAVAVSPPMAETATEVMPALPPPWANARDTTSVPPPPPPHGFGNTPPPPLPSGQVLRTLAPAASNYSRPTPAEIYAGVEAHKSRVVYVLLGLFLGAVGAQSFYAGRFRRGAAQVALSVFWMCLFSQGYGALIAWIWAIVEICVVTKDADGVQFS